MLDFHGALENKKKTMRINTVRSPREIGAFCAADQARSNVWGGGYTPLYFEQRIKQFVGGVRSGHSKTPTEDVYPRTKKMVDSLAKGVLSR